MERLPLIPKRRTFGEISLSAIFVLLAIGAAFIATRAYTPAYAFHMALFSLCSVLAVVAINMRFDARPIAPTPLVIDGKPNYNYGPIKFASLAALFWGTAGFIVGLYLALELSFPILNFDLPWINFGRLRPLHTSAVIFAFGGNVLLATSFYVVQRTSRARIAGDLAPWFVVLGYNFFILIAGTGYLLGITRSHEYAEPEWYAILWLVVVWVDLSAHLSRDAGPAHGAAYLRRELVLSRLYRDDRGAGARQQHGNPDFGVLAAIGDRLVRRAGRDDPVVVRT